MAEQKNPPPLRFRRFGGPWDRCRLGDAVHITMGQSPDGSTYSNEPRGHILVQGNADLQNGWVKPRVWTTQVTKTARPGDLLMSVRAPAGAMGKTAVGAVIGRGVAAIRGNEFIYQLLVKMDWDGFWRALSCGSTFEALSSDNIKNAEIARPGPEEQAAIGQFFSQLDGLILLHRHRLDKLQTVRRAMLEKMFPREGAALPEIRFRDFSGGWDAACLGDIASEVSRTDQASQAPVMMITAANGFIRQADRYSFDNAGQSLSRYIVLKRGELAYNHGASKLRPYGSCFALEADEARVPYVYHCFSVRAHNPYFISLVLNGREAEQQLRRLVTSGARMDGLLNISFAEYATVRLRLPVREEQDRIAACFQELDTLISLCRQRWDRLLALKKAMLERMLV